MSVGTRAKATGLPPKRVLTAYDYHQVMTYLEKKYNFQERDFHKHFTSKKKGGVNPLVPYSDFWHWVIDHASGNIHNGAFFVLGIKDFWKDKKQPEFVRTILGYMAAELKDELDETGAIEFYVEW